MAAAAAAPGGALTRPAEFATGRWRGRWRRRRLAAPAGRVVLLGLLCLYLCFCCSARALLGGAGRNAAAGVGSPGTGNSRSTGRRTGSPLQEGQSPEAKKMAAAARAVGEHGDRRRWGSGAGEAAATSGGRRRYLAGPGSYPPRCLAKCGTCNPCKPVHVPVPPGTPVIAEYYPEAWRCKCGGKLYLP